MALKRYTVNVSDKIDYVGFVWAEDEGEAEQIAREVIDIGTRPPHGGEIMLQRIDREVMAAAD